MTTPVRDVGFRPGTSVRADSAPAPADPRDASGATAEPAAAAPADAFTAAPAAAGPALAGGGSSASNAAAIPQADLFNTRSVASSVTGQVADRAALEAEAGKREQKVLEGARALPEMTDPAQAREAQTALKAEYQAWRATIADLVAIGALDSPVVKSFTAKTAQAALLGHNVPADVKAQVGSAYRDAVAPFIERVLVALTDSSAAEVVANNPLLQVPTMSEEASLEKVKREGVPTTEVVVQGKKGEARKDVVMVFCPGVARSGKEFVDQQHAALKAGFASTRAETGSFIDAEDNAKVVAGAVRDAKALVGNPDAKVILVGYSQGNTNLFAFMRDRFNQWGELRKDVVAVHDMHSAAGGSHLADLAFALGRWLTTDNPPDDKAKELLYAFSRANEAQFHLPHFGEHVIEQGMILLDRALSALRHAIQSFKHFSEPIAKAMGIELVSDEEVGKRLVELALNGEDWVGKLEDQGWAGRAAAAVMRPLWNEVQKVGEFLGEDTIAPLIEKYIKGGLYSLTTEYGQSLMSDPQLRENMKNVVVLNSTGAVPMPRELELVPKSQRLGYQFFRALGLDNDYQVAVEHQKVGNYLPNAVDLPPEAVGHWGVAGVVVPRDHGPEYFRDFSPSGLTRSALATYAELGIV